MLTNLAVALLVLIGVHADTKPMVRYRYETEDLMQKAASSYPMHGYRVIESGYYPAGSAQFAGSGSGSGFSGQGFGQNRFFGGFGNIGNGFVGGGGGFAPNFALSSHGGGGGEYFDKNAYEAANKNLNDGHYEKNNGVRGEAYDYGQEGYHQGKLGEKNVKEDSGFYKNFDGGKKAHEDGKSYHGGQHFNQEGKTAGENKQQGGHKKGHKVKGFKTFHHKDESGKTEEYYDEANDEGNQFQVKGESGGFGQNAQSAYKGGHQEHQVDAKEQKKQGHFEVAHAIDSAKHDQGHYGEKKHSESNKAFGFNNGIDEQSLLGHQEAIRTFKKYPYHTPFFHH